MKANDIVYPRQCKLHSGTVVSLLYDKKTLMLKKGRKERETYSEFQPVIVPVSFREIFDKRSCTLELENTKCDSSIEAL